MFHGPPAPSATRTATSRPRATPRDSRRFARLTHAISSSAADAHSKRTSAVCVLPVRSSRNGVTITEWGPVESFAAVTCRLNAAIDSLACSSVTAGLSRATTCSSCHPKLLSIQAGNEAGIQMSMSRAGRK